MHVVCFDFDGVICDSAPETALTAWLGCRELWPPAAGAVSGALPAALQERFCRLRPVLHTGYEAIPLMRLILAGRESDDAILTRFGALRDALLRLEGLSECALQERFGTIRDRLIAADPAQWLRSNPFYPGAAELLRAVLAAHPLYVITTKQERFATLLLDHHGVSVPPERIHGLERGRGKPQILAGLLAEPAHAGATFHFIEDRLDTLQAVMGQAGLDPVRLYLADWGYNTPAQREEAGRTQRIQVVSLPALRLALGV
jgi:phosphoglycolate phosphatase-like HAD superfamily hydrolase